MNQFKNILSSYLQRPGAVGDPLALAKAPVLLRFAMTLIELLLSIKTVELTEPQRRALSRKGDAGQRRRSQAFQEFLARRPDFAAVTNVDPDHLQQVIDKDQSFESLGYVVATLARHFAGAELQLGAYLSREADKVLKYLRERAAHGSLDEVAALAVAFVPLVIRADEKG